VIPPVEAVPVGAFTVLTSLVSRAEFDAADPANRTADPDWMAHWTQAHHAVNLAATGAGPCLPLAFGVLFSSLDLLRDWLAPRAAALQAALATAVRQTEWALSVQEDAALHAAWLEQHDPALRRLADTVRDAGTGTAFLLSRQLERARAVSRAAAMQAVAERIEAWLKAADLLTVAEPPRAGLPRWTVLEPRAQPQAGALPARLEALAAELAPTGILLRLTGPWPAYHAARAATEQETTHG
jgi:hypothetical protein